jgi:hypothetical protein
MIDSPLLGIFDENQLSEQKRIIVGPDLWYRETWHHVRLFHETLLSSFATNGGNPEQGGVGRAAARWILASSFAAPPPAAEPKNESAEKALRDGANHLRNAEFARAESSFLEAKRHADTVTRYEPIALYGLGLTRSTFDPEAAGENLEEALKKAYRLDDEERGRFERDCYRLLAEIALRTAVQFGIVERQAARKLDAEPRDYTDIYAEALHYTKRWREALKDWGQDESVEERLMRYRILHAHASSDLDQALFTQEPDSGTEEQLLQVGKRLTKVLKDARDVYARLSGVSEQADVNVASAETLLGLIYRDLHRAGERDQVCVAEQPCPDDACGEEKGTCLERAEHYLKKVQRKDEGPADPFLQVEEGRESETACIDDETNRHEGQAEQDFSAACDEIDERVEEQSLLPDDLILSTTYNNLADTLSYSPHKGKRRKACPIVNKALLVRRCYFGGPDHSWVAESKRTKARILLGLGKFGAAAALAQQAMNVDQGIAQNNVLAIKDGSLRKKAVRKRVLRIAKWVAPVVAGLIVWDRWPDNPTNPAPPSVIIRGPGGGPAGPP